MNTPRSLLQPKLHKWKFVYRHRSFTDCDICLKNGSKTVLAPRVRIRAFKNFEWENLIAFRSKVSATNSQDGKEQLSNSDSIIYPWDRRYRTWSVVTTAAAAFSGFFIPLEVALGTQAGAYDLNNPLGMIDAALVAIFAVDLYIQSHVVRLDSSSTQASTNVKMIQKQYFSSPGFLLDLAGCVPLDYLALMALHATGHVVDPSSTGLLPALKILYLVRLNHVRNLVTYLLFNLNVPLLWVTVMRNVVIVMLITHWVACTFWWEARAVSFYPDILVGVDAAFMGSQASFEQYVVSLYWAVTTLSMVEANNAPETLTTTFSAAARASLFLLFNITLGSYVLGTITLLVVKQDERTGKYRDQSANLREFTSTHSLPADLKESLQEHLRLHFDTSEASEEQVLSVYPTAIRRRILRFLYLKYLKGSYLFEDAPPKLLDALLAAARVETFMPNVDIVGAGDYVNELLLLVSGTAEIRSKLKTSQDDRADEHIVMASIDDPDRSLTSPSWEHDGKVIMPLAGTAPADGLSVTVRKVGPGELLGEAAFFTEVPQLDAISSSTVCRVLVISRAAYQSLERAFPVACRNVWSALQRVAETTMNMEFLGKMRPEDVEEAWAKFNSDQLYTWASAELDSVAPRELADAESLLSSLDWDHDVSTWSLRQQLATANLMRIRACVQAYIMKQEADRTAEFLNAASMGNIGKIREMLLLGCPPNSADYDGRCALELACVKGHVNVAKLLLASGANPSQRDNLGLSPLAEACKLGHDELIDILVKAGATMTEANNDVEDAKKLCSAVFVGDLPQVKRLLRCGLSVDAGDYDKRTALHIAAAEGNLTIVRVLVEGGNANIEVKDRWGFSPLDEAMRVRAGPVIEYLEHIKAARATQLITSSASFIPASAIYEQQALAAKQP